MKNVLKIDPKSMPQKSWKIDAKMAPKIIENWSKNRPGADLGPLILGFWAFWHDDKKSRIFGTPLVGQKIGKFAQGAALGSLPP